MKTLTHPAIVAFGASTLYLLILFGPLVSLKHMGVYHLSGSILSVFVPIAINLFIVWLFLSLLLRFTRKTDWYHKLIWTALIVPLPWILVKDWFSLTNRPISKLVSSLVIFASVGLLAILLSTWQPRFSHTFERIQGFVTILFSFASFSGVVIVGQMLWFGWQARTLNTPLPLHKQQTTLINYRPRTRVVWVLLDELSYQQVYEQRFPGLQLPAFDQLAAESAVFTHAIPTAMHTEVAVPSLMTGLRADDARASANGLQLSLRDPDSVTWHAFDQHQTVFQDALNAGYRTAVVGWFNPYCRIMPAVLDWCFWVDHLGFSGGIFANQSIAWNTMQPIARHFASAFLLIAPKSFHPQVAFREAEFHKADYLSLFAAADKVLVNPSADFVFLHMPVPHPVGIYNRNTSTFTTNNSSYIDNLALADQYLAHVRLILQKQGEWDSSAVIVMGDHSWRTKLLWVGSPTWTSEDQAASHGAQFDDRPGYIVKMPYQRHGERIDERFDAVHTRALLDGIIDNKLRSPEDLSSWVRQQRVH